MTARNKMMDLLARRDHSEKELLTKLRKYSFSQEEIEKALLFGKERGWLPNNPDTQLVLSEKMASGLHKKKKGILYINNYLREKGLPALPSVFDIEVEKAKQCIQSKLNYDKIKLHRFLLSRGFEPHVAKEVLRCIK